MRGLLARKVGMTQVFTERGTVVPVTVLEAGPCRVVQRKTTALEGYEAVQIGFGDVRPRRVAKPLTGHFKRAGLRPMRSLAELRDAGEVEVGRTLTVELFEVGQRVDVTGTIELPEGTEMVMPGDNVEMSIELITPIAVEDGMRFAIREGGRTVGAGSVTSIVK